MKVLRTASLGSNFTGSYRKKYNSHSRIFFIKVPRYFFAWDEAQSFWCSTGKCKEILFPDLTDPHFILYSFINVMHQLYTSLIFLKYVVKFEFVYILYKSDSFTLLINWPTILFLNSCFNNFWKVLFIILK